MGPVAWARPGYRLLLLAVVPLAIAFSYLASPYVALWRLSEALRTSDCAQLRIAIDWDRVRAGLEQEIAGSPAPTSPATVRVASASTAVSADDDLPGFGESFASNAVGNALSEDINPEHFAAMMHDQATHLVGGTSIIAQARQALAWAFFSGPRTFDVWVRPGEDVHADPVRLQMTFTRHYGWRVEHVWLPQDMLGGGDTHNT